MRIIAPLALLAILLAGCDAGRVCTLIACSNGLEVRVTDPPRGAYTAKAVVDGEVVQTIECPGGTCPALFFETTAAEVTIVVEWEGGMFEQTLQPAYQQVQPNGRGCPPVCTVAVVEIEIGA